MAAAEVWTGRVVVDRAELAAMAEEWADLYRRCPSATPFQAHAWVAAYDRAYVRPGALRLVEVRRDGVLMSVAPLVVRRRGPVTVLTALGGAVTDHHDVLMDPAVAAEEQGWAVLTRTVLDRAGWHVLDLPEVRPGAAAEAWLRHWPGPVAARPASVCLELPVSSPDEALARLPGRTANTLRRKIRKVDAAGVERRQVTGTAVAGAVDRLLGLHARQWAGRGGNPEHLTARYRTLLGDALERMVQDHQAVVTEFWLAGRYVAAEIDLVGHDELSYYLAGVDPDLRQEFDTSCLLVPHGLELARQAGVGSYSLLRGEEDYKHRWRPDRVQQRRLLLARPRSVAGWTYLRAVAGGLDARRVVKARAPWLRTVRDRIRRR